MERLGKGVTQQLVSTIKDNKLAIKKSFRIKNVSKISNFLRRQLELINGKSELENVLIYNERFG